MKFRNFEDKLNVRGVTKLDQETNSLSWMWNTEPHLKNPLQTHVQNGQLGKECYYNRNTNRRYHEEVGYHSTRREESRSE